MDFHKRNIRRKSELLALKRKGDRIKDLENETIERNIRFLPEGKYDILSRKQLYILEDVMRKADREITNLSEIADVFRRCDTVRIGLSDDPAPYIVPVSFGYELRNDKIAVYFHGALEGRKAELLNKHPIVCVEADLCHGFVENGHGGLTCDYESVIGYGTAELLEGEPKEHGLRLLLEHCGTPHYRCTPEVTTVTAVVRVVLDSISGKRRFTDHD